MKKWVSKLTITVFFALVTVGSHAQCSICTKTASQLGEGPAKGLNAGILYLAATPFLIIGYLGYRWFQAEKEKQRLDAQPNDQDTI